LTDTSGAHSIIKTSLLGKLKRLLVGSSTSDNGVFSVEVLGHLLERSVAGFDVEEVDDAEFESEPAAVNDVVFPADLAKSDGVDVRVEEDWSCVSGCVTINNITAVLRERSMERNTTVIPFARML